MVAQFLRLKLTLFANSFRRRPARLLGMLLVLVVALVLVALVTVGIAGLRSMSPDIARAIVVVFGTIVTLGFIFFPLVFGVDDSLDPRRFTLYGIPTARLARYLAVGALLSIPSLVAAVLAVAQIVTWSSSSSTVALAIVATIIIVPTCVLAARVSGAIAGLALAGRRARELAGAFLIAVLAALAPFIAIMETLDWGSSGLPIIRRIATIATWTPFGAVWSIPADAAAGRSEWWIKLLIALAFLLVLWITWRGLVALLVGTPRRQFARRAYSGLGWFEAMPATPGGAVAARILSYWGRDARYRVALLSVPLAPLLMIVALAIAGVPGEIIAWIPVPVMCLFVGWVAHNDVAYDGTAFWTHLAANISGAADRWGRAIPALILGIPLAVVGSVVTCAITADWAVTPGLMGLSLCVLFVGLGISSVTSAAFPYATVRAGDGPFEQPQATDGTGSVVQGVSFFLTVASGAPIIYLAYLGATDAPSWYFVALLVGVLFGAVMLAAGVFWGGRIASRRAPELLAFTLQN